MSIDWTKAPEGATHYQPESRGFHAAWFRLQGGEAREMWVVIPGGALEHIIDPTAFDESMQNLIARPVEPATWNGKGLPPVGTVCEYRCHDSCEPNVWTAVHVLAHAAHGSDTAMLLAEDDNGEPRTMYGRIWVPGTCRPLRTPEQIAAEEREKAIEEMCFAVETLTVKQAKALYDAGYRRREEGK